MAFEQAEFQDKEYFDNFCSRNVIKKMKSEGQKNTILLRYIVGTTGVAGIQNHSRKRRL